MRVCVVGAGAIGGYVAVRLARAGETVTVIARGAHLEAIRREGLTLVNADGTREVARPALATDAIAAAGAHDVVVLAVKAPALAAMARHVPALFGPATVVLPMQNGIPWWYFAKHGGPLDGTRIRAVDPDGALAEHLDAERVIGCVVYPATELAGPGIVRHLEGNRVSLGELDGSKSARVAAVARAFGAAGLRAPVRQDIRSELWVKLWGNLSFNPISALTRATLGAICRHPPTRALAAATMAEAQAVAERLGVKFAVTIEQRIKGAADVGEHKTSMLQDIESGRPTEIDALVGAVAELGRLVGVPTPHLDMLYASVTLLDRSLRR